MRLATPDNFCNKMGTAAAGAAPFFSRVPSRNPRVPSVSPNSPQISQADYNIQTRQKQTEAAQKRFDLT
jgi:hypothetical protein